MTRNKPLPPKKKYFQDKERRNLFTIDFLNTEKKRGGFAVFGDIKGQRDFVAIITLRISRATDSRLSGPAQCNHKGPFKWKRETEQESRRKCRWKNRRRNATLPALKMESGPAKKDQECRWVLGAGKARKWNLPYDLQRALGPVNTLILGLLT